jgi:hypothetical protein
MTSVSLPIRLIAAMSLIVTGFGCYLKVLWKDQEMCSRFICAVTLALAWLSTAAVQFIDRWKELRPLQRP